MASDGQWQSNGFEDQFRRMILNDNSQSVNAPQLSPQRGQPTVRLPHSGPHISQQQFYNDSPTRQQQVSGPPWHTRNVSSPQNHFGQAPGPINQPMYQGQGQGQPHRGFYAPHERNHQQHGLQPMLQPVQNSPGPQQRARYQQPMALDPNAFHRGGMGRPFQGRGGGSQQLFNPNRPQRPPAFGQADRHMRQAQYLEQVAAVEVRNVEMSSKEHAEKEEFRTALERICHEVCAPDPERLPLISLEPFGSFRSGFATAGSDMDLVIVVKDKQSDLACFSLLEDDLPRALEKRLLQLGYGARLLTRTRVPIIKVCQSPGDSFLDILREERWKWDDLPNEKKYPHLHLREDVADDEETAGDTYTPTVPEVKPIEKAIELEAVKIVAINGAAALNGVKDTIPTTPTTPEDSATTEGQPEPDVKTNPQHAQRDDAKREDKPWTRERKAGPLDFPKTGVGIQSDINFFNPLGLHNTQLLRCYSLCDPRVRPMVLFVKAWAKKRKINSSYSGTLSSYGYVLMVLHYLVNVAQPSVVPNLQAPRGLNGDGEVVDGWNVNFQRNEDEIVAAAQQGRLTSNREPLGALLSGFFQYYASQNNVSSFRWTQEVLSLRTQGGIMTKVDKEWIKAKTEESEGKKVQHRYLFCIEDPFELDHNVARTVTHNGIVAIRDEFRRANRILQAVGNGQTPHDGELFAELIEPDVLQSAAVEFKKANEVQNGAVDGSKDRDAGTTAAQQNMTNMAANKRAHELSQQRQRAHSDQNNRRGGKRGGHAAPAPSRASLDVTDNDAFPSLGATKPGKKKAVKAREGDGEFSEISGERAKAHLEEVKRMKHEAQAESTATGAAEAVLSGID